MQTFIIQNYKISLTETQDHNFLLPQMFQKQFHSTILVEYKTGVPLTEWDGIFSNQSNILLGIRVSDCNVIIIMGQEWFGIVHAGRKGLKDGIIQKMFKQLIEKGESGFYVFIWPSIRSCCYEVGKEFTEYFDEKYLLLVDENHYTLDMIGMIQDIFSHYSIKDLIIHPDCTKCSSKFFSYRQLKNYDQVNIIMVEKLKKCHKKCIDINNKIII